MLPTQGKWPRIICISPQRSIRLCFYKREIPFSIYMICLLFILWYNGAKILTAFSNWLGDSTTPLTLHVITWHFLAPKLSFPFFPLPLINFLCLPESPGWMKAACSKGSSGCLRGRQVGCQWRHGLGVVTWVVGKLDGDWLSWAFRESPIQFLDGPLGLDSLVKTDEAHTFGKACGKVVYDYFQTNF